MQFAACPTQVTCQTTCPPSSSYINQPPLLSPIHFTSPHFTLLVLIIITSPHFTNQNQTYSMAEHRQPQQVSSLPFQAVKAATAFAISGTLLFLSGLTLTGTVIGLALATPLLVIFSPVLVPAAIVIFLLVAGIVSSGGFGVAAVSVMSWIYQYVTGKRPLGADKLDHAQMAFASKARDMKEKAEQYKQQAQARAEAAHSS